MRSWVNGLARLVPGIVALTIAGGAAATEGALGRPVAGTTVLPNAGVVPPAPVWVANLGQL